MIPRNDKGTKKKGKDAAPDRGEYDGDDGEEDDGDGGDNRTSVKKKKQGNQDLWLLNVFFKGCAVVW